MDNIEYLKEKELILSMSYWENFKFSKDITLSMGATHPKVIKTLIEVENIRQEWHDLKHLINTIEEGSKNI